MYSRNLPYIPEIGSGWMYPRYLPYILEIGSGWMYPRYLPYLPEIGSGWMYSVSPIYTEDRIRMDVSSISYINRRLDQDECILYLPYISEIGSEWMYPVSVTPIHTWGMSPGWMYTILFISRRSRRTRIRGFQTIDQPQIKIWHTEKHCQQNMLNVKIKIVFFFKDLSFT